MDGFAIIFNGICKNYDLCFSGFRDVGAPPGQWVYVSDTLVQTVPEARVLNAQAYLLFYEQLS